MTTKIKLCNAENAGRFINLCSKEIYSCADINVSHGNFTVDGRSILGILSLGTEKVVEVEIITENKRLADSFIEELREFEVID